MQRLWSALVKFVLLAIIGSALLLAFAIVMANRQLPSLDAPACDTDQ